MLIAYRPELENPPREGGFGVITDGGVLQFAPGVNRDVPADKWKKAKDNAAVKRLLQIGAIEELKEEITAETIPQDSSSLASLPLSQAIRSLEIIHDEETLVEWKKVEGRIRVRNAISKRQEALRTGNA